MQKINGLSVQDYITASARMSLTVASRDVLTRNLETSQGFSRRLATS